MSTEKSGRTFWDYLHEHPIISYSVFALLLCILLYLISHNYTVSTSGITPPNVNNKKEKVDTSINEGTLAPSIGSENKASSRKAHSKVDNDTSKNSVFNHNEGKNSRSHTVSGGTVYGPNGDANAPLTYNFEKLKQRHLSDSVMHQIINYIPNKTIFIKVIATGTDRECMNYGMEILDSLKKAGYNTGELWGGGIDCTALINDDICVNVKKEEIVVQVFPANNVINNN